MLFRWFPFNGYSAVNGLKWTARDSSNMADGWVEWEEFMFLTAWLCRLSPLPLLWSGQSILKAGERKWKSEKSVRARAQLEIKSSSLLFGCAVWWAQHQQFNSLFMYKLKFLDISSSLSSAAASEHHFGIIASHSSYNCAIRKRFENSRHDSSGN